MARPSRRIRSTFTSLLAAVVAMMVSAVLIAPAADAATPWGSCGKSAAENKEVARYFSSPSSRTAYYLRCGNANFGYRHIINEHYSHFQDQAAGTYQNWRDIADLAIETLLRDPDATRLQSNGKACHSRVLFLRNIRTNQTVRQQNFRLIYVVASKNIITVFPDNRPC